MLKIDKLPIRVFTMVRAWGCLALAGVKGVGRVQVQRFLTSDQVISQWLSFWLRLRLCMHECTVV
jgi:hypothetical protein